MCDISAPNLPILILLVTSHPSLSRNRHLHRSLTIHLLALLIHLVILHILPIIISFPLRFPSHHLLIIIIIIFITPSVILSIVFIFHFIIHLILLSVKLFRFWKVLSSDTLNATGKLTGYKLMPAPKCLPFAPLARAAHLKRAQFLDHQIWVTTFKAEERYPG